MHNPKLRCGCEPGRVMCIEAERLWKHVMEKSRLPATNGNYKSYREAKKMLAEHFRANQPAMEVAHG